MNKQFEENFNKLEASLKRSKEALDCIGEALKDITGVVYQAYLQEQSKPNDPQINEEQGEKCPDCSILSYQGEEYQFRCPKHS
jgi:hypothetical protein